MIDSHCHLDLDAFANDVGDVIRESKQAGVTRFLIPGTTPKGWIRQQELARDYDDIDLAFGLHPYFISHLPGDAMSQLVARIESAPAHVVALGEIGLDASLDIPARLQEQIFEQQLLVARDAGLPVILHHRKTQHRLIKILKDTRFQWGGVLHAFSGSEQVAGEFLDLGFKLGVGGTITYDRAQKTRQTIGSLSLADIVLETDAPDMPMAGRQGQRNSPAFLPDVVNALCQLCEASAHQICQQTTSNYLQLFSPNA